ncbi:MAG: hypothetical protein EXR36_01370 [Betaproteobacteria bacterium]|nr:hypothetical protein [Betaproteobacteria bacterium]
MGGRRSEDRGRFPVPRPEYVRAGDENPLAFRVRAWTPGGLVLQGSSTQGGTQRADGRQRFLQPARRRAGVRVLSGSRQEQHLYLPVARYRGARDHAHGIATRRETEDLDFAFAVPDWAAFETLRQRLIASGKFTDLSAAAHRLRHQIDLPVDLVPFGNVETPERTIAWPPSGEQVMNVFGFREALATALETRLPGDIRTHVVSLPALALLKIVCWKDRHYQSPRKDAHDLILILGNYLGAGNEARLFDEFVGWTREEAFDYGLAGARTLGHDVRTLLGEKGIERVAGLLSEQASSHTPALLPAEMYHAEPDHARALLTAMLGGLLASWRK